MSVLKLNSRERAHLGLTGLPDVDYRLRGSLVEVLLSGVASLDTGSPPYLYPGDVVTLWSNAAFHLDNTVAVCSAHPALLAAGFCSFPSVMTEDHQGKFTMLFKCEREINLADLPYLAAVASLGTARQ